MNRARRLILAVLILVLTLSGFTLLPSSWFNLNKANAALAPGGSWNPNVPCSPTLVSISDITALQTGPASFAASPFSPGIVANVPGGIAKRWLTPGATPPGWVAPGPPCKVTNSDGVTSLFVEINGLERGVVVNMDYTTSYDPVNGGSAHPVTGDTTFNLFDPNLVANYSSSCTSPSDPTCTAIIHGEIDQDWKAAGYCGPGTACDSDALATQTIPQSTLIDVQGFVNWDPAHLNEEGHQFNGWEIHPLTAWRFSTAPVSGPVSLSWTPTDPQVGQIVNFTAKATGANSLSSFRWDFGDDARASGREASHIYLTPQTFNVQLSVIDGLRADTVQGSISVGSWNPAVACSPTQTSIEQILGNVPVQRLPANPNSTGADYSGGGFRLDGDLTNGSNPVNWPFFKRDLQPPCSVNGTASFVELHNVTATNLNLSDCGTSYTTDNSGGSYPNGWQSCDTTLSLVTPGYGDDSTCPGCYLHRLYAAIDRDWNASGAAPLPAPVEGERIDVQGFVFWNHDLVNASFHSFSGWELHPITAWKPTLPPVSANISFTPTDPTSEQAATFNATVSGGTGPYTLAWDFGDGHASTGDTVSHAYGPGSYKVHLAATDSLGTVGTTSETVKVAGPPRFTISASKPTLTIHVGNTESSTISLRSIDGFSSGILLFPAIYPSGPGIDLDPSIVQLMPYGRSTAVLTLTAGANTPPGHYTVLVLGFGGGMIRRLLISVEVVGPSVLLDAFPDRLLLQAGASGKSEITLSSFEGFSGDVNLVHSPLPPGVAFSASPAQVRLTAGSSDKSLVKISTSPNSPAGTYVLAITADHSPSVREISLQLIIEGSIAISATPTSLGFVSGSSKASTISLRSLGFKGTAMVSASVSNPGLGATISPVTLSFNSGETHNAELKVFSKTAGNYYVTIIITTGHSRRSFTIPVVVMDFEISSSQPSLTIKDGSMGNSTIILRSLNGFSGNVNLGLSPAPGGFDLDLSTPSVALISGGTGLDVLAISSTATSLPGNYIILLKATSGSLLHTVTITVTITA